MTVAKFYKTTNNTVSLLGLELVELVEYLRELKEGFYQLLSPQELLLH